MDPYKEYANVAPTKQPRRKFWKVGLVFVSVVAVAAITYLVVFTWLQAREAQEKLQAGQEGVEKLAEAYRQAAERDRQEALADTYGGRTPQETLQMYIAAVEQGDYQLASKYFIGGNQEKELESLKSSERKDIENVLILLRRGIKVAGSFSLDNNGYAIRKPVLIDFILYPNGIWKIIEI